MVLSRPSWPWKKCPPPGTTTWRRGSHVPDDTLVVHGEQDDVVPLAATLAWARPQSLPVVVVPGGGHFFHGQLGLLKAIVLRAWHATP